MGAGAVTAFSCTSAGKFPDPSDCTAYYYCAYDLEASRVICPSNMYYGTVKQTCELGNCSSSSTAGNTTRGASAAYQATNKHFASNQQNSNHDSNNINNNNHYYDNKKPKIPTMHCTSPTDTFPDPNDCHKYFRCDENMNIVSETCSLKATRFDDKKGGCYVGKC